MRERSDAPSTPPPRGAVVVVAVGLLVTSPRSCSPAIPAASARTSPYKTETDLPDSPTVALANGGNAKIVDGVISTTADNDFSERLYRIEASLRARAGAGAGIDQVRCQV